MPLLPVTLAAPAKLTLSLRVTRRRPDGFHDIDAEMVTLDLADEVELRATERDLTDRAPFEVIDARSGTSLDVGPLSTNLVTRALEMVGQRAGVRVVKRIPPGAGLGGGSSDAAAVLRWAGCTDLEAAATLGADVPFCLAGGRARVRGLGERVEPLAFEPKVLTLLTPPFGCSTVAVYRAWDDLGGPTAERPTAERPNDLEPAALVVEPRLAQWRDRLAAATGQVPRLAGSGSTWFVEGSFPGAERLVVRTTPAPETTGGDTTG
jgi:4-diphosphocytidyl-2-C-methyl-D-erythritol kinase